MNHEKRVEQWNEMKESYRQFGRKRAEYVVSRFNESAELILKAIGDHKARLEGDVVVIPDFGILQGLTPHGIVEDAVNEVKNIYLHDQLTASEGAFKPIAVKMEHIQILD